MTALETPRTLCVIPARGGSKRVPRKNVRLVAGVPMIARTIAIVTASGVADRIVVSTDDEEIAEVARQAGAGVPFMRPQGLADDYTPTAPVIRHAVQQLEEQGDQGYGLILVVYPTAVLLEPADLSDAREALLAAGTRVVMSVGRYRSPIERAWRVDSSGRGHMPSPEYELSRTQDLPASYFDAGQFYFGRREFWMEGASLVGARPTLVELPGWRAIDIDTAEDVALAELLLEVRARSTDLPSATHL